MIFLPAARGRIRVLGVRRLLERHDGDANRRAVGLAVGGLHLDADDGAKRREDLLEVGAGDVGVQLGDDELRRLGRLAEAHHVLRRREAEVRR